MKGSKRRQRSSDTKPMPKFHLQALRNILCYLFSSTVFFKVKHYSFFLQYLYFNILKISIFIHVTLSCLKNLLPHGYIALYFLCITYLEFSVLLKIEKKKKANFFQRKRQALNSPGSPEPEGGFQSTPFSQISIFSELHCSFAVKKSHCGTLKISILSTIISLSILSCLSVQAGTIWF